MLLIVGSFKKMTTFATARNLNNPSQIISERDFFWVRSARALSNGWKRSNVKI